MLFLYAEVGLLGFHLLQELGFLCIGKGGGGGTGRLGILATTVLSLGAGNLGIAGIAEGIA